MSPVVALVTGLLTGLSLIVVIGAQNAFVLRQGILRRHVGPVVGFCIASDAVLMVLGTLGVGVVVGEQPAVLVAIRWVGVVFLVGYAAFALRRAVVAEVLTAADEGGRSWGRVLVTVAAFTWLNPHVYLDTVVLLGSLANTHGSVARWWFTAGSALGSAVWFGGLGFGARLLAPVFARPLAWRLLDVVIFVMMTGLAVILAVGD
jgi:L-lysine exporter family protein LysE/ArgO